MPNSTSKLGSIRTNVRAVQSFAPRVRVLWAAALPIARCFAAVTHTRQPVGRIRMSGLVDAPAWSGHAPRVGACLGQLAMDQFDHILNWTLKPGSHPFPGRDGGTCINEAAI